MKDILPIHYKITSKDKWIRCKSRTGLRTNEGKDDDEAWTYVFGAIKQKYDIHEVYFSTNSYYQDFTDYIK